MAYKQYTPQSLNVITRLRKLLYTIAFTGLSLIGPLYGETRLGADKAAPHIQAYLEGLSLPQGRMVILDPEQVRSLIGRAAELKINVFEMIDSSYRFLAARDMRIRIEGDALRALGTEYDFGGDRVEALMPIAQMRALETGASFEGSHHALDVFLAKPYEAFIEIGTASYATHFGFSTLSPLVFDDPFGISVKKFLFSTPLDRLELYEPGKGAIYATGVSRPKRWNLWVISKNK